VSASPNDGLTDLTINYVDDEKPIEDAPFSLYLVAMVHDDGSIELTDEFSEAQISGNTLDYIVEDEDEVTDNSLFGLAETFESYILVEEAEGKTIKPVAAGETDNNGELDFASLTQGIYLLTGDTHEVDEQLYIPTASLIALPYVHTNGNVDYSPSVLPKYEVRTHSTPGSNPLTTEMHVQKIWEDNSSTARPAEVDVMLFKDGEKYDEVKLNEKNSWYHTWKNLDKDSRWQLGEVSVPNGYTVLTELEGSTFVVVNTLETTTPTPTTTTSTPHYPHGGRPKTPSTPSETPTEVVTLTESPVEGTTKTPSDNDDGLPPFTTEIVSDESPETPTDSELVTVGNPPIEDLPNTPTAKTKLPQTGQLWWPVPLLAFGGLIAYVAGRRLKTDVNASSKTDVDSDDEK
jgi:hypothetical protein